MPTQTATTETTATQEQTTDAKPLVFDEWIATQEEPVKAAVNARFQALENTVRDTRQERDTLSKQVKDLLPKAEKGSELEKTLLDISGKLETTERRAAFLEDAMRPEVQCRNAKAAWILASAEGLFDKHGRPDWNTIKAEAPELFGVASTNANAGTGTGQPPPGKQTMNDFIRTAAGR